MLTRLSIANVVLIESLTLEFNKGFTVLTGETGSGKSILLDALGLALGTRADTGLIRQDAPSASVSAEFDLDTVEPSHPLFEILTSQGIPLDGNELIIRRHVSRDQRSKILINDTPITLGLLKSIGKVLMDIHGQFDDSFSSENYLKLIDDYAKTRFSHFESTQKNFDGTFIIWKEAQQKLVDFEQRILENNNQKAFMELAFQELSNLKPLENEEEDLIAQRESLSTIGKANEAAREAVESLSKVSLDSLFKAQKTLERYNDIENKDLKNAFECLERAGIEIQEAQLTLDDIIQKQLDSAQELLRIDERLYLLRSTAKKLGIPSNNLKELYEQALLSQEGENDLEAKRYELEQECKLAYGIALGKGKELSNLRQQAALELEKALGQELPDLKLEHARFRVSIANCELAQNGIDTITFMVSMNPGQEFSPLHKTASGGELSRLMLALKVSSGQTTPILIFDEIDKGVSGSVATAIGKRLNRLGQHKQVFAITHSAQVGACANHHYIVNKSVSQDKTNTHVNEVKQDERTIEIARLLAGQEITTEAIAAAEKLICG